MVRTNEAESDRDRDNVTDASRQRGEDEKWIAVGRRQRTYAKIAGGSRAEVIDVNWKTPEAKERLETMVTVKSVSR